MRGSLSLESAPIDPKENQMPKMSPLDLKAMLASEKANALAAISAAKLMEERADAMDYYLGDMRKDMPAQDGRSRAVSTDVADTIEGLMPNLMDIFAGSDEVVRFEPVGPEDEAAAQQETDYVNHVCHAAEPRLHSPGDEGQGCGSRATRPAGAAARHGSRAGRARARGSANAERKTFKLRQHQGCGRALQRQKVRQALGGFIGNDPRVLKHCACAKQPDVTSDRN